MIFILLLKYDTYAGTCHFACETPGVLCRLLKIQDNKPFLLKFKLESKTWKSQLNIFACSNLSVLLWSDKRQWKWRSQRQPQVLTTLSALFVKRFHLGVILQKYTNPIYLCFGIFLFFTGNCKPGTNQVLLRNRTTGNRVYFTIALSLVYIFFVSYWSAWMICLQNSAQVSRYRTTQLIVMRHTHTSFAMSSLKSFVTCARVVSRCIRANTAISANFRGRVTLVYV